LFYNGSRGCGRETIYLDLERDSDIHKLEDPEAYLSRHFGKLVILDEVQRKPGLFPRMPRGWNATFFRTCAQAEIDLVLEAPGNVVLAIEIKRSLSPTVSKGFLHGCEDVRATQRYYVIPQGESHPLGKSVEVVGLEEFLERIEEYWVS